MKYLKRTLVLLLALMLLLAGCSNNVQNNHSERTSHWYPRRDTNSFSDAGYYYTDHDGQLCFLDLKNGGNVILCSKVACLHSKEPDVLKRRECETLIGADSMFFWDGKLYYTKIDTYGYQLYRRAAEGLQVSSVRERGRPAEKLLHR